MKPIEMTICGWGPFKQMQRIDFSSLQGQGIFLITGATGAGKTTIFDALAYALYGEVSGEFREKSSVRSDFAEIENETSVSLIMTHRQETYEIIRNPEYLRPKKRKTGKDAFVKEKERALLKLPDGSMVDGATEVTLAIKEVLAMDYRQFKQISMLAQGEFSRLLTAGQKEKTEIFRGIFDTFLYEAVSQQLRKQASNLLAQVKLNRAKMEEAFCSLPLEDAQYVELVKGPDFAYEAILHYLQEVNQKLEEEQASLQEEVAVIEEKRLVLERTIEQETQLLSLQAQLDGVKEKALSYTFQEDAIRVLQERINIAKKSAQIEGFYQNYEGACKRSEVLQERMEKIRKEIDVANEILEADVLFGTNKEELLEEETKLQKCITEMEAQIVLDTQIVQVKIQLEQAMDTQQIEQAAYQRQKERYVLGIQKQQENIAGQMASQLREGEACPVCGSSHHPLLASSQADTLDEKELELLQRGLEEAQERMTKSLENVASARARLEEMQARDQGFHEIWTANFECTKCLQRIGFLIPKQIKDSDDFVLWKRDYLKQQKTVKKQIQIYEDAQQKQKEQTLRNEEFGKQQMEIEQEKRQASERLQEELNRHELSLEVFLENRLSFSRMQELEKQVEVFQKGYQEIVQLKKHLETQILGRTVQEIRPLLEQRRLQGNMAISVRTKLEGKTGILARVCAALQSMQEKYRNTQLVEKEYGYVKDLDNLANGNNPDKLVFEQFVLFRYFDYVLKEANSRLAEMTDGRYELAREERVLDGRTKDSLAIRVMDYYTGKYRSVKTLSGGESFKTSLALALGLSTVMQQVNGGVLVETLFIDEGFGSLDEESLEQACNCLLQLAGYNRMIGIISHVTELKEKIFHKFIVTKTNGGSEIHEFYE